MNDMKCNIQRYKIMDNGDGLALVPGGDDANGHGSMCISTIYKECPQVEILSIRIFDSELDTSIRYLEYALECLLYRDVKVINLSLALTQKVDTADLLKICRELEKQGKIIIAAVENGEKSSQPSNYKGVIGVQGELIRDNIWELRLGNLDFIKQSIPFLHTDQHNYYKMFGECNSSAAAMVKTTIIITHRISSINEADYVYVLENHRIAEEGTPQFLKENGKKFAKFKLQDS